MAGPWEQYASAPTDGPWTQYNQGAAAPTPQVMDGKSIAADVAKSGGIGLAKGAIGMAGLPGDIGSMASAGLSAGANALGIDPKKTEAFKKTYGAIASHVPSLAAFFGPGSSDIQKNVELVTGDFYQPKTTAGEYAQTIGEFVPAAAGGPGSLGRRLITQAAIPALASETAGQLTQGTAAEPYARIGGAVLGGVAPSVVGRAITPLPTTNERANLVNTLRNEGVTDLTAGQTSGSRPLQWMESSLSDAPFSGRGTPRMMDRQAEQFTQAALRRVGSEAPRATPEVVDEAFRRIGGQFDDLAGRNNLHADSRLSREVGNAVMDYENLVPPSQRAPIIGRLADDVRNSTGVIAGDRYQGWRSTIERLARGSSNNPQVASALRDIKSALDDAMERSISTRNPADLGAWREARRQYRNLLVVEKAATGAGAQTAEGLISPSQLRNAVVGQGRRAYARGQGDFADLARAGEAIMKPLPQSGTGPRSVPYLLSGIGAGAGNVPGAIAAFLGPGMASRTLMSRPVQTYLGNQLMTDALRGFDPRRAALTAAAIGAISNRQGLLGPSLGAP